MPVAISQIIRSKRKTITLMINSEAQLIIRAPLSTPDRIIEELVEKKADWITKKQEAVQQRKKRHLPKHFREGEDFLFLGTSHTLHFSPDVSEITAMNGFLLIPAGIKDLKQAIIAWYRAEALRFISCRLPYFTVQSGVTYKSIKITGARKRWGSCGSNGSLNFSWRLVMCPPSVVDYVVAHEVSHLKHHNHSREFWQAVQILLPDYKTQKTWLRENQSLMEIF